jgi:DNA modification methylase
VSASLAIMEGDWVSELEKLPAKSVQCCVTSPPYWGLRNYGARKQVGLEKTPAEYVEKMVAGFRGVYRVLRDDGTLWVVLGDSYATGAGKVSECPGGGVQGERWKAHFGKHTPGSALAMNGLTQPNRLPLPGLKPKDLIGIPWRVAFALQADGWHLRCDVVWNKPNAMPECVKDRPTRAHEYVFLLSKSRHYYYDAETIKEPTTGNAHHRGNGVNPKAKTPGRNSRIFQDRDPNHLPARKHRQNANFSAAVNGLVDRRNKRSVWTVATAPYRGAHFATFPGQLIRPCILAGTKPGDVVLDPFFGSGTTGEVALSHGRSCIGIELNAEYIQLARERCARFPQWVVINKIDL